MWQRVGSINHLSLKVGHCTALHLGVLNYCAEGSEILAIDAYCDAAHDKFLIATGISREPPDLAITVFAAGQRTSSGLSMHATTNVDDPEGVNDGYSGSSRILAGPEWRLVRFLYDPLYTSQTMSFSSFGICSSACWAVWSLRVGPSFMLPHRWTCRLSRGKAVMSYSGTRRWARGMQRGVSEAKGLGISIL